RTARALDALDAVYRAYARADLHRRASRALALVDEHRLCRTAEDAARRRLAQAEDERGRAAQAVERLEAEQGRLTTEIQALTARPAYQAGAELTDLRDHVASLDQQVADIARQVEASAQRGAAARQALDRARGQADGDLVALRAALDDLTRLAVDAGLTARVPDVPTVETRSTRGDGGSAPVDRVDVEALRSRLAGVRASARARSGDVAEVRQALQA